MNKKKNMRRMAGAMAVVVAAGAAGTCGYQRSAITAKAAEVDTEKLEEVAENALSTKSDDTEETGTTKEESVYVKADPSGKVKKTTVTEWLKNTGKGELSDTSDLSDIKNIKGDEEYKESGDELSWEAVGDDIYYQGTTDKELPVGVKISYKLDGKDISAEDLQGKDGKVEIHIKYSNTSKSTQDVNGTEEEVFTPFTMITAMLLPADQYENVQIDNGKVISDAERQIVVGLGFPGLNDNLKLEDSDLELPEEVTITADVKNATVEPSITVATTDFLQDLDTDNIDDFSDLSNSIDELKDATNQLVDGSKEAADGASQLADGAGTLKSGTAALATGANTLVAKVPTLVQGVTALDNGASDIQGGLKTLQASVDHKKDVTNPKDQSGLVEGAADLSTGVNDYTNNVAALKAGMEATSEKQPKSLMQGGSELAAGAKALQAGVETLNSKLTDLQTALGTHVDNVNSISKAIDGISADVTVDSTKSITKEAVNVNKDALINQTIFTSLDKTLYDNIDATQVVIYGPDKEKILDIEKIISEMKDLSVINKSRALYDNNFINNKNYWLDIVPLGSNKGDGVLKMCKYLNVPLKDTVRVGDDLNDLPMFFDEGLNVCVDNGMFELKQKAGFITKSCAEDGVAYLLENIIEEKL